MLDVAEDDSHRQKCASALFAPSRPPTIKPCASTTALIEPALVAEMPSTVSWSSSRKRSSTPQVKAPWLPPPCNAKLTAFRPAIRALFISLRGHRSNSKNPQDYYCDRADNRLRLSMTSVSCKSHRPIDKNMTPLRCKMKGRRQCRPSQPVYVSRWAMTRVRSITQNNRRFAAIPAVSRPNRVAN